MSFSTIHFSIATAVAASLLSGASTSAQTPRSPSTWRLVVDHAVGDGTSDHSLFTDVRGLALNKGGDLFVLDVETQDIRMFDRRGGFVKVVARKGRGPGELVAANGLLGTPDEGFAVNDVENGRISIFNSDGSFQRQILLQTAGYDYTWRAGWDSEGRIIESIFVMRGDGGPTRALRRIRLAGVGVDTIAEPSCIPAGAKRKIAFTGSAGRIGGSLTIPFASLTQRTLDGRGSLWCSSGDIYQIERFRIGTSDKPLVVARSENPERISASERDSAIAMVEAFKKRYAKNDADVALIPATKPVIEGLVVDDQQRLWVRRPSPAGRGTRFDVFDSRRRFIASVEGAIRVAQAIPPVIVGDTFYAVTIDADGVQSVVVARVSMRLP